MNGRMILILGVGLVGMACGTTRLDAGSKGDGGTPGADAGLPGVPYPGTPSNSFDVKCELPAPDWFAGSWQGEFDAYTLPSGSKAVRIEFTGAYKTAPYGAYGLCGTVTLGEGVPPPVATDPQAPPPGGNGTPNAPIIEGFAYEFGSAGEFVAVDAGVLGPRPVVDDRRVRFGITLNQIYKSWCNLQLSYPQFDEGTLDPNNLPRDLYRCVPQGAYNDGWRGEPFNGRVCDSGLTITGASCAQALYCFLNVCECSGPGHGQGCSVGSTGPTTPYFDLSLAGTILAGNVALGVGIDGLHLTRVP